MTKKEREKLKVKEIKFVSTNSFFNESFNQYLSKEKDKPQRRIGYESNRD